VSVVIIVVYVDENHEQNRVFEVCRFTVLKDLSVMCCASTHNLIKRHRKEKDNERRR